MAYLLTMGNSDTAGGSSASYGGSGGSMNYGGNSAISYSPYTAAIPAPYTAPEMTTFTPAIYDRENEKPYYQQFMAPMLSHIKSQGAQAQEAINVSDNPNVKAQLTRAKMAGTGEAIAQASGVAGKEAIGEARTDWQSAQQAALYNVQTKNQTAMQNAQMEYQSRLNAAQMQNQAAYQNMMASLQAAGMTRSSGGSGGGTTSGGGGGTGGRTTTGATGEAALHMNSPSWYTEDSIFNNPSF
jgi:ribosomal protein L20